MVIPQPAQSSIRLGEVVGSLSLVTDLATGQPLERGLRWVLVTVRLGEDFSVSGAELNTVYYGEGPLVQGE